MIGIYNYTIIPTILSVISGTLGIYLASTNSPLGAIMFMMFSGALDIFDGKIANTKELSAIEKRFGYITDSISDMLNFGVLPIVIAFSTGNYFWLQTVLLLLYPVAVMIRLGYISVCQEARQNQGNPRIKYYEGFPISYISIILPVLFLIHSLSPAVFSWVYFIFLILLVPAMLLKFKIPKPKFKISLYILGAGVIELILLLLLGKN